MKTHCIQDIENSISHIHPLDMVHGDIKPENLFVDLRNGRFVVGDFDSVHREGAPLWLKMGTDGWVPLEEETGGLARYTIDWYSSGVIRAWLETKIARGQDGENARCRTRDIISYWRPRKKH
jgi:serine/threonine protein kinase